MRPLQLNQLSQPLIVGTFGSPHGVRGWLKIHAATEDQHSIINYQPWFIQQDHCWVQLTLQTWRQHRTLTVKLTGFDNRESVQLLTNCQIAVDAARLPTLPSGEYYWRELLGCQVVTVAGYALGQVTDLLETGSNDVLVVKANHQDAYGRKERLIPLIDGTVIQQIDTTVRLITVSWDPGF